VKEIAMFSGSDVVAVAGECAGLLRGALDRPWDVPVPDLDWNVAEVVAHAAEGCLWYAIDLAAAGKDLDPVEHRVKPDSQPGDILDTMETYARLVAWVVDTSPPETRGFHPWGMADPSGFAAMACDELLVHTDDAARGLGLGFEPDRDRVARVLRRLFPWAPTDGDPWASLRWANGRIELHGRPRLQGWSWHCAPLDEWDGRPRTGAETG
jgi:hypothetical protein